MAGYTDDFGLLKLGPGDTIATDNYKFADADRELIARLLRLGAETHHHNGAVASTSGFDVGNRELTLTHGTDTGQIPAGVRVFYRFTLVDADGFESEPADPVYVDTPNPIVSPAAPTAISAATGGALLPGNYYYQLTAYTGTNTQETKAGPAKYILVPSGTTTNTVTLTFPALPAGATGFNIYRKKPGGVRYDYLASVAGSGPTYLDTGTVEEDCNRTVPAQNFTASQNHVVVDLTGDALPAGTTWRLYRTYAETDYVNSRIATGISGTTFDDLGTAGSGSLPTTGVEVSSPSKVMLTDAEEVQGYLPMGMTAYPFQVSLTYSGPLVVAQGAAIWRCDFPMAEIVACSASLGRGSAPASTPVIVDVNKGAYAANPTLSTIYTTTANRPSVAVGEQLGVRTTPDVKMLAQGDILTMDIDQTGGGATPTDRELTLTISLIVHGYPIDSSYVSGASGGATGEY